MSRPRKRGRDIDGVFLLDKPQGMSSNDIMQKVKRLFQANKAGPVSYTHLDVYKRQSVHVMCGSLCFCMMNL